MEDEIVEAFRYVATDTLRVAGTGEGIVVHYDNLGSDIQCVGLKDVTPKPKPTETLAIDNIKNIKKLKK